MQVLQAGGQLASGFAKASEADSEAQQLEINAGQTIAGAQREAFLTRQKGEFVASRQRAIAAGSGTTATDVGVTNLVGETGREAEYSALSSLYTGQSQAQQMRLQAQMARYQGKQDVVASGIQAIGTLAGSSGGDNLFEKYGMGGPGGDQFGGGKGLILASAGG